MEYFSESLLENEFDSANNFSKRHITISLQTNGRKKLTIISDFGTKDECEKFARYLKKNLSTGGAIKIDPLSNTYVVMIQGDCRDRVFDIVINKYNYDREEITMMGG